MGSVLLENCSSRQIPTTLLHRQSITVWLLTTSIDYCHVTSQVMGMSAVLSSGGQYCHLEILLETCYASFSPIVLREFSTPNTAIMRTFHATSRIELKHSTRTPSSFLRSPHSYPWLYTNNLDQVDSRFSRIISSIKTMCPVYFIIWTFRVAIQYLARTSLSCVKISKIWWKFFPRSTPISNPSKHRRH